MLVKPYTAFTGVPSGRVIGGKAWKARKMKPDPSIRIKCSLAGAASAAASTVRSMSAGVIGSRVQDVQARAVRAHHLLVWDAQENPRVTQRTVAAIAGDSAGVDMDDLGRCHGRGGCGGGAVRHDDPLSGLESGVMIAMREMLSTFLT
jgi:hypothetical protein